MALQSPLTSCQQSSTSLELKLFSQIFPRSGPILPSQRNLIEFIFEFVAGTET